MISFFPLAFSAAAVIGLTTALPGDVTGKRDLTARQAITSSQTGTYDGYYYSFWTNGDGTVDYTNTGAGAYSVTWSNSDGGDFTAGVGWNPGSAQ